jgi:hypothetical protein
MRRLSFQVETVSQYPNRPLRNLDAERAQYRPVIVRIVPEERSIFGRRLDRSGLTGARFH